MPGTAEILALDPHDTGTGLAADGEELAGAGRMRDRVGRQLAADQDRVGGSGAAVQAIVNNPTAVQAIIGNTSALQAIVGNQAAVQAIVGNASAVQAIISSPTAVQAIVNNPAAVRETQYDRSELVGRPLATLFDEPHLWEDLWRSVLGGDP